MSFQERLERIWQSEEESLRAVLSPDLLNFVPVSLVLYQPGHREGEAVYLSADHGIRFPSGPALEATVLSGEDHAWKTAEGEIDEDRIKEYGKLVSDKTRLEIFHADEQRFGESTYFDESTLSMRKGTKLMSQAVVPSPLWHGRGYWWTRLPRLGIAYSIEQPLMKFANGEPGAAERVLFVSAMALGNRALDARLDGLVFGGRVVPVGKRPDLRDVANSLLFDESYDQDSALCLLMRLILTHHFCFPQSPRFLDILKILKKDAGELMDLHGWPSVENRLAHEIADPQKLGQYCDELLVDLRFLLEAAGRWIAPRKLRAKTDRPSGEDLKKRIEPLAYKALALLTGVFASYSGTDRTEANWDTRIIEPPLELLNVRSIAGVIKVVGLSKGFLTSTGKTDSDASWPLTLLHGMGTGDAVKNISNVRYGGKTRKNPYLSFARSVGEIENFRASEHLWEIAYVRARSAIFEVNREEKLEKSKKRKSTRGRSKRRRK
jgi:hypothetical protein